jgi:hypothetical protein
MLAEAARNGKRWEKRGVNGGHLSFKGKRWEKLYGIWKKARLENE